MKTRVTYINGEVVTYEGDRGSSLQNNYWVIHDLEKTHYINLEEVRDMEVIKQEMPQLTTKENLSEWTAKILEYRGAGRDTVPEGWLDGQPSVGMFLDFLQRIGLKVKVVEE